MEFFGAKRRFFLEIFFGDFRREAPIFFGDFGDFLEILKFFLEFSEILGDFLEIFWEVFFGDFFWRFSPRSGEFFLEFLELILEFFRREAAKIWRFFLEVS